MCVCEQTCHGHPNQDFAGTLSVIVQKWGSKKLSYNQSLHRRRPNIKMSSSHPYKIWIKKNCSLLFHSLVSLWMFKCWNLPCKLDLRFPGEKSYSNSKNHLDFPLKSIFEKKNARCLNAHWLSDEKKNRRKMGEFGWSKDKTTATICANPFSATYRTFCEPTH